MNKFLIVGIISSFCFFVNAEATENDENNFCNICFKGKPSPDCCSFLIFETGMLSDVARSGYPDDKEGFLFTADLGLMFNKGKQNAWGGSFHFVADDDGHRFGIGPRYRKWLKNGLALDFAPRLMIGGSANDQVKIKFPGFAVAAALSVRDIISLDVYYQRIPYEQTVFGPMSSSTIKKTETGLYVGASGRSFLAPILPIAFIIIIASVY